MHTALNKLLHILEVLIGHTWILRLTDAVDIGVDRWIMHSEV